MPSFPAIWPFKNNCMCHFRCIKCGDCHNTRDYNKKDRNTRAKCALCSCDHPANYKSCQVYKAIMARRKRPVTQRSRTTTDFALAAPATASVDNYLNTIPSIDKPKVNPDIFNGKTYTEVMSDTTKKQQYNQNQQQVEMRQ